MRLRPTFTVSNPRELNMALEMWTQLAAATLRIAQRQGRPLPKLYQSGVRYRREGPGREEWLTPPQMLRLGHGDCEDLATWRAAELRLNGYPDARVVARKVGPTLWHITVRATHDGREVVEDPSAKLGMQGVG